MKKVTKLFLDIQKEQEWLASQKGWKLIHTNGIRYTFEESKYDYSYEYIYFHKNKKQLSQIIDQILDKDIEFVCNSSSWALFRKDTTKGEIRVFDNNYINYRTLMNKCNTNLALGACYICLGSTQTTLTSIGNKFLMVPTVLFYVCSLMFFLSANSYKKYSKVYDDGTYAERMKKEKRNRFR